ncbi:hypothetical protein [Actinomadura opuntiae]|uniref:hypothetical protein n=1 Tax=Actinomadura sp. OS1-43 TaxID=604315 RepID=UPI00255AF288|nr:hypothetical protein [Actinomadura sp. OS1-43]MDL4812734.1 hypothetical protein [Actinomadura sp. OS1-43]
MEAVKVVFAAVPAWGWCLLGWWALVALWLAFIHGGTRLPAPRPPRRDTSEQGWRR